MRCACQRDSEHPGTPPIVESAIIPAPGGPYVVCERFEHHNNLNRGLGEICTRPADAPRVGCDLDQESCGSPARRRFSAAVGPFAFGG